MRAVSRLRIVRRSLATASLALAVFLAGAPAVAQTAVTGLSGPKATYAFYAPPKVPGYARAAGITGLVEGSLLLAGATTIAIVDRPSSEGVTRGLLFGGTVAAAPIVALGAYLTRRRARLSGSRTRSVRSFGWLAYGGALGASVLQWYGAFHGVSVSPGLTVLTGVLSCASVWSHAFDAYMTSRQAEAELSLSFSAGGLSFRARF